MPVPVRVARPDEAALVAHLNAPVQDWHARTYPERFHATPDLSAFTRHFAEALADPAVTCLLSGDPAQGYALCRLIERPESAFSPAMRRILVEGISVLPQARRQGHGRALLTAARELADREGCDEIVLDTWAQNHPAHAFFEAQGFAVQRMLYATRLR